MSIDHVVETPGSLIAYGTHVGRAVVLKIVKFEGDEWRVGETLDAFEGRGAVRVFNYVDGAALLERACPGDSLVRLSLEGRDDEATKILATLVGIMSPRMPAHPTTTAEQWARSFARYAASGDGSIPRDLVSEADEIYADLCATQQRPRLLHGDLQHYNVVLDDTRGWLAIDPKGVIGEIEYELGAWLRNPIERPGLFADQRTIERRTTCFASTLRLDVGRILAWGFSQAVLSAIWDTEDEIHIDGEHPALKLAVAIRPMLRGVPRGR